MNPHGLSSTRGSCSPALQPPATTVPSAPQRPRLRAPWRTAARCRRSASRFRRYEHNSNRERERGRDSLHQIDRPVRRNANRCSPAALCSAACSATAPPRAGSHSQESQRQRDRVLRDTIQQASRGAEQRRCSGGSTPQVHHRCGIQAVSRQRHSDWAQGLAARAVELISLLHLWGSQILRFRLAGQ